MNRILAFALSSSLLAAACGSDDSDGPNTTVDAAADTTDAELPGLDALPIQPREITKVTIPDPSEMAGGIGNALAWDATEGVFWTVTDQQPAMTEPWLLHLYRVRLTGGRAETGPAIPIRENGKHLKGGELDPEGIAVAPDGSLWVVDEGAPALLNVTKQGDVTRRIEPTELLRNRENNRGLEGVALGTDGKSLFAVMQNGVQMETDKLNTFIAEYELAASRWIIHPYRLEDPAAYPFTAGLMVAPRTGAHDLHAIGPRSLLVLERDNQSGAEARIKRIYLVDLPAQPATAPLAKKLVVDLVPLGYRYEQPEGITMRAPRLISIANDNDALPGVPTELWEIAF